MTKLALQDRNPTSGRIDRNSTISGKIRIVEQLARTSGTESHEFSKYFEITNIN